MFFIQLTSLVLHTFLRPKAFPRLNSRYEALSPARKLAPPLPRFSGYKQRITVDLITLIGALAISDSYGYRSFLKTTFNLKMPMGDYEFAILLKGKFNKKV